MVLALVSSVTEDSSATCKDSLPVALSSTVRFSRTVAAGASTALLCAGCAAFGISAATCSPVTSAVSWGCWAASTRRLYSSTLILSVPIFSAHAEEYSPERIFSVLSSLATRWAYLLSEIACCSALVSFSPTACFVRVAAMLFTSPVSPSSVSRDSAALWISAISSAKNCCSFASTSLPI